MRVLIVDDSVVFRSQIKMALEGLPGIEVCGVAMHGKIALQKLAQDSVDLVTLDMEMPEMGGLETIQAIKQAGFKTKIIVFSASTSRGSEATLAALAAGADDFVAKPNGPGSSIETAAQQIKGELVPKIQQFQSRKLAGTIAGGILSNSSVAKKSFTKRELSVFRPTAVVIGSSTGGPPALEKVLAGIKSPSIPIIIAQHMPPVFTATLAQRLEKITGVPGFEIKMGMPIEPGKIYVAPGNYHAYIKKSPDGNLTFHLDQGPLRNSVRPAVDHLFESAAEAYGSRCLGIVLTGMGEDGRAGCISIKDASGGIMIQNQESCVVFGMPGAVFEVGAFDRIGSLEEINLLVRSVTN